VGPVCSQLGGNDEVDGYGGCNKSGEAWIYGMLDSEVKMRRKEEIIEARNGEAGRQKACAFPSEKTTNDDRQMKTRGGYPCNPGENFRTDAYGQGKRIPLGVRGTHLWKIQTPYLLPDTTEKVKRRIALTPTPRDVAQNSWGGVPIFEKSDRGEGIPPGTSLLISSRTHPTCRHHLISTPAFAPGLASRENHPQSAAGNRGGPSFLTLFTRRSTREVSI
jgi:hypothetical protein